MAEDDVTKPEGETPEGSTTGETLTPEQLKAALTEAQKRIKDLNKESAERRKKLELFERADAEKKNADLTEAERLKKQLSDLTPAHEKLQAEHKALLTQRAFEKTARELKLEFASEEAAETAYRLLDVETIGEDLAGMKDAVTQLVKKHVYLLGNGKPLTPPNLDSQQKGKTSGEINTASVAEAKRATYGAL